MSFYRNRVYPHIVTVLGNPKPVQKIRQRLIPRAQGTVLEVGVGPGINFAYYDPTRVSKIYALEPNPRMMERASNQQRRTELDVEFLDLPGERIPLSDASVDTVVSTFTLCTIPGGADAIRGIARVLRPGGQFLFFEHGLSPDPHAFRHGRVSVLQQSSVPGDLIKRWIGHTSLRTTKYSHFTPEFRKQATKNGIK